VPATILADPGRLRQVLLNLVGNAIKFTKAGEVAVRATLGNADGDARTLRVEVRDTGIGIEDAVKARLFQPFSQADMSIRRRFGGTGLGLSISRHIIELMGGTISLESEVGKGTTVVFEIPLITGIGPVVADPADWDLIARKRILVVDDRLTNRDLVASYLGARGAIVEEASSLDAALERICDAELLERPFDVVVVDRLGPGLDGAILADRMADTLQAAPPVILLRSAHTKSADDAGQVAHVHRVVSKPVRRGELLDAVLHCLRPATAHSVPIAAPVVLQSAAPKRVSGHVLLAEDNPVNVIVAQGFLEEFGCTCDVAETGAAAVEALKSSSYPLILMDCQMPEMDGLTATRQIRAREASEGIARTPIIAVTANAYVEDRAACLAAGMDDYLSKPYTEEQLLAVLEKWLPKQYRTAA